MTALAAWLGLLAAVVFGVISFLQQGAKAKFRYRVWVRRLLSPEIPKSGLDVSYCGQDVTEVWVTDLLIHNSGRRPIDIGDFRENLVVNMGDSVQLLGVRTRSSKNTIRLSVELREGKCAEFTILPALLNGGDYGIVRALTSGPMPTPDVTGRIVNINRIERTARKDSAEIPIRMFYRALAEGVMLAITASIETMMVSLGLWRNDRTWAVLVCAYAVAIALGLWNIVSLVRRGRRTARVSLERWRDPG